MLSIQKEREREREREEESAKPNKSSFVGSRLTGNSTEENVRQNKQVSSSPTSPTKWSKHFMLPLVSEDCRGSKRT